MSARDSKIIVSGRLNFVTNVEFEDNVTAYMKEDDYEEIYLTDVDVLDFDGLASIKTVLKKFQNEDGTSKLKVTLDSTLKDDENKRLFALLHQVDNAGKLEYGINE